MKITNTNMNSMLDMANARGVKKDQEISKAVAKSSDFDKITIGSNNTSALTDAQFISTLKKNILAEIQKGASEYKLNDLKQQIAMNQYDINISEIAKRMMLDSYEVCYE